jgi:hypothetical protein
VVIRVVMRVVIRVVMRVDGNSDPVKDNIKALGALTLIAPWPPASATRPAPT